jgi:hypothetical protein
VLLKAGVAVVNLDYDPDLPYSQEILIPKPKRICSYDETKMELDYTRGFKGRKDKAIRNGPGDDGKTIVKSPTSAPPLFVVVSDMADRSPWLCVTLRATLMNPHGLPTT